MWFFYRLVFNVGCSFNLEFRNEIDNVCGHSPQQLACDGTHMVIQLKNITAINKRQLSKTVSSSHIRFDRVVIPGPNTYTCHTLHLH